MSSPEKRQRRRDDLLEALFWLTGERIEAAAAIGTLATLIGAEHDDVAEELRVLAGMHWVRSNPAGEFELTDTGHREAARRFADSFADILGRQGHGACDDDCECHASERAAAACHEERAGHVHP